MAAILHQFAFSHFNEKARWALAYKNVPYVRNTYLPGLHIPAVKKLSGQSQTPVLELEQDIVSGSQNIIERLETDYPEPALYPADPVVRETALALQAELDDGLGPAVRTLVFAVLVEHGGYLCRMFAGSKSLPVQLAYRVSFPLARPMIAKGNGVTPENISRCREFVAATLEDIAERVAVTGYLVGNSFSVADLTAAALLAPIANVDHVDMKRPDPLPVDMQRLVAHYSVHPAIDWTRGIYAKHRPTVATGDENRAA